MLQDWPAYDLAHDFPAEERAMERVMEVIRAVRARRSEMNVAPGRKAELTVVTAHADTFRAGVPFLLRLASASAVAVTDVPPASLEGLVTVDTPSAKCYIPLAELVDLDKERARVAKELEKARKYLAGLERKLSNESFVAKAPEAVVARERANLEKTRALIAQLEASAAQLG